MRKSRRDWEQCHFTLNQSLLSFSSRGQAFYSSPFRFKKSTNGPAFSFSTSFVFAIVPNFLKPGGHGLDFTITPSKLLITLPNEYLGILNAIHMGDFSNHLVAVEFDTVQNLEFRDINDIDNHVGIDINSLDSKHSVPAGYYTHGGSTKQNLHLPSGKPIHAWIDYDSIENIMNVTIAPTSKRPTSPIFSFHVDLSQFLHEFIFKINGQAQALDLSSLPSIPRVPDKHTNLAVAVSVSSVVLVTIAISIVIYLIIKIKNADVIEDWELEIGLQRYSYQELNQATNSFSDKSLLGQGSFGRVYKGQTLRNSNTQVAVKRVSNESNQGLRDFVSEIYSIGRLRHRNLVQLLGWCRRRGDLLLVYDFMANGSLDKFRQGRILDVVDTRLNGMYDEGQMMMVLELGLICSNDVPAARPSMRQLVRYLDGEAVLTENLTLPAAFDCGKIITKGIEDTELSHEHDVPTTIFPI
ncbi:hypothetical protein V6N13_013814 [Hibiscus sabdariffa]